jgi:DNA-binding transcriptional ArsR family regulator
MQITREKKASQVCAKRIIDVFLSSEAMADIVLLFRGNPTLIDHEEHIASIIGKDGMSIQGDLKKLTELGILEAERIGKKTWFGLDIKRDLQIQEMIKDYILSCGSRSNRSN